MTHFLIEYNNKIIGNYTDYETAETFILGCLQNNLMQSMAKILKYKLNSCYMLEETMVTLNSKQIDLQKIIPPELVQHHTTPILAPQPIDFTKPEVIEIAKQQYDLDLPFIRSEDLSNDTSSTFDVISHAIEFYQLNGIHFEKIMLLQPTSPFRTQDDFMKINEIYRKTSADMVVSVKKSKESPYFNLFQEDNSGCLKKIISSTNYITRQECPPVYIYNGSMYLFNVAKYLEIRSFNFQNIIKYEMPECRSVDIDTQIDWILAEYYINL